MSSFSDIYGKFLWFYEKVFNYLTAYKIKCGDDKNGIALVKDDPFSLNSYLIEILNENLFLKGKIEDIKSSISGGEKQRVSIARAFLKNPKILLLDEPTSALDKKNEIEVTKSLDELMKGRTTFIVTHRLDTIKNADIILVFENGRLVQKGTHEELTNVNGQYKFLFSLN